MPPRPRAVARVLRVRVLGIEKRLRRIELFFVRLEEIVEPSEIVALRPVAADERIALDVLDPEIGIRLVEKLLPDLRRIILVADALALCELLVVRREPVDAPDVVVAVDEELLDLLAAEALVLRKNRIPRVREDLELADAPLVGDIACHHHAVDAAFAEKPQRIEEVFLVSRLLDVHVAHYAEAAIRPAAAEKPCRRAKRAPAVQERERPACANKRPSREFSVVHVTP